MIRTLAAEDREAALALSRGVYNNNDYLVAVVDEWFSAPGRLFPLGFYGADGRLVGIYALRVMSAGRVAWLEGLRVAPDAAGQGIGTQLTEALVALARDRGLARVAYTIASQPPARRLAERFGLALTHTVGCAFVWAFAPRVAALAAAHAGEARATETSAEAVRAAVAVRAPAYLVIDWKASPLDCAAEAVRDGDACFELGGAGAVGHGRARPSGDLEQQGRAFVCTVYADDLAAAAALLSALAGAATAAACDSMLIHFPDALKEPLGAFFAATQPHTNDVLTTVHLMEREL